MEFNGGRGGREELALQTQPKGMERHLCFIIYVKLNTLAVTTFDFFFLKEMPLTHIAGKYVAPVVEFLCFSGY